MQRHTPVEVPFSEKIPSPSDEDVKGQLRKVIAAIARDSKQVREFLRGAR